MYNKFQDFKYKHFGSLIVGTIILLPFNLINSSDYIENYVKYPRELKKQYNVNNNSFDKIKNQKFNDRTNIIFSFSALIMCSFYIMLFPEIVIPYGLIHIGFMEHNKKKLRDTILEQKQERN